jgi:hypothetical protein
VQVSTYVAFRPRYVHTYVLGGCPHGIRTVVLWVAWRPSFIAVQLALSVRRSARFTGVPREIRQQLPHGLGGQQLPLVSVLGIISECLVDDVTQHRTLYVRYVPCVRYARTVSMCRAVYCTCCRAVCTARSTVCRPQPETHVRTCARAVVRVQIGRRTVCIVL